MERNLRAFLAVARAGNLTAAADKLGLTQPALTKTIRRLEQDLETSLFQRTSRGMVLSDTGRMLLERAGAIEMHFRQAQEEIAAHRTSALPAFRVAAGTAYHAAIAPDLARRLAADFPATRLHLTFELAGDAMPKLVAGDLDLLLGGFITSPAEGIETRPLFEVEIAVWSCKTDPLAAAAKVEPSALRDRRWVVYRQDRQMVSHLQGFCASHMLPQPRIVMEVDSLIGSFRVVSGTPYLTAATTHAAELAAAAGLEMLTLDLPIWRFLSGAWYRCSQRRHPIMSRALDILSETAARHAPHSAPL